MTLDSTTTYAGSAFTVKPPLPITGQLANFIVPDSLVNVANPKGSVTIYMHENKKEQTATVAITDAIRPKLVSVSILENENHADPRDTLKVAFSEPVNLANKTAWPFNIYENLSPIPQTDIRVISATTTDEGKSWMYVIEGNAQGAIVKPEYRAEIAEGFAVSDMSSNELATCAPVTITESTRPVPVRYAKISDFTGDGQPDEIYVEFIRELREKDIPDTVDVYWGNPAVYTPFAKPAAGWTLEPVLGEMTAKPIMMVVDSTPQTREKYDSDCKDVLVVDKRDTTYVLDSITGLPTDVIDHIDSVTHNKQECKKVVVGVDTVWIPQTEIVGYDSVQSKHSVIKIAIPEGVYKNATYGANGGSGEVLPRRGSVESLLDATRARLNDDCPPVIISATWQGIDVGGRQTDFLKVTMSEPLDSVANQPYLIERRRDGIGGTFYQHPSVNSENRVNHANLASPLFEYRYDHEALNAIWFGDSVRLVTNPTFSFYKDAAGLFPGVDNPWVPVSGNIKDVKVDVKVVNNVTVSGLVDTCYGGFRPLPGENFRLSLINKDDAALVIASGDNDMHAVTAMPVPNYRHAGPVFKIELTLPEVDLKTSMDEYKRDYTVAFELALFNNIGSFVNRTKYRFNTSSVREFITASNTLTLYLEWTAPEDYPASSDGKKIGTGPYIAKFNTEVKGIYVAKTPDKNDNKAEINDKDTFTRTFGFRRLKK